ncbi:hypothetical protein KZ829_30590 [Actinoplanes hulinensis]|uniref:Uncharacterized protein n=1 Tax=Actinoplanes hulinensis TaxID=1144547 RepID=A0ABS7BAN1_9ACTN|nr:hypothetical protein [Actinoplanes hulinensis]MBW6438086.1 hypothetical protein [Actinoplanes hulinensis]
MAGWGVERDERATSRSLPGALGGSPLMPSHSQGAERRTERRAGRTGSRWILRAFVVGGLAGAAWLLTGSAAHAADHEDLLGSALSEVATVTGNEPTVGELLEAAVRPLETSMPVEAIDEIVDEVTAIDGEPVGASLRTAAAAPRASGGPVDDRAQTEPVPVGSPPEPPVAAAAPVTDVDVTAAVPDTKRPEKPVVVRTGKAKPKKAEVVAGKARAQLRSHVQRRIPAARPAPETARDEVPDDGPTPRGMNLGAVSGIPASGSGSSSEAGSVAVLPARLANGAVANHQLPVAADVEARRNDAEAPTVSPD